MLIQPVTSLKGEVTVPGDKSISHRSVMFGSIAEGITEIEGFLQGADCLSTIGCFRKMGIPIENTPKKIIIHGKGLHGLSAPLDWLDVGNSGTTTRLISGILCGQDFDTWLSGDASLNSRPMKRIMEPLRQMGGTIESVKGNDCAPLHISPGKLHGIHYHSRVASAQVKSCVLLAGLYAEGETRVTEPVLSRNHTELMLSGFGADIRAEKESGSVVGTRPGEGSESTAATAIIQPCRELFGQKIVVPGDISSAAYFIAAGLLVPNSEILIKNVGINPTRAGILRVVKDMGGDITYVNERTVSGEPVADILVKTSTLHGTTVGGPIIPTLIDELPMIAVLAAFADGTTIIKDAAELKVKETNRIDTVTHNLQAMGGDITPTDDGMIIRGGSPIHGAELESFLDHRIAMAFAIGALAAEGESTMLHSECVDVSYPDFFETLEQLQK